MDSCDSHSRSQSTYNDIKDHDYTMVVSYYALNK